VDIGERQRIITAQPRPRTVALSQRGKSWIATLAAAALAIEIGSIAYLYVHASGGVTSSPAFVVAVLMPFSPVMFMSGLLKQRALVQNGEVAVATVTLTSRAGRANQNDDVRTVNYRFRDGAGAVVEGTCADGTLMLRPNSAMLIFYERDNPANQVAQCASYYRVVGANLDDDWLDRA
jgi:hypothetical protein